MLSCRDGSQSQVSLTSEPRTPPLLCHPSGLCVGRVCKSPVKELSLGPAPGLSALSAEPPQCLLRAWQGRRVGSALRTGRVVTPRRGQRSGVLASFLPEREGPGEGTEARLHHQSSCGIKGGLRWWQPGAFEHPNKRTCSWDSEKTLIPLFRSTFRLLLEVGEWMDPGGSQRSGLLE